MYLYNEQTLEDPLVDHNPLLCDSKTFKFDPYR
jgi:hypothetical protein